jgi:hypothetical protein
MPLLPQVPLADDSACQGGVLVFAGTDGRLLPVTRRVGNLLAHDGGAVHGVTALVAGIRLVAALDACPAHHLTSILVIFPTNTLAQPSHPATSSHATLVSSTLTHLSACMGFLYFACEILHWHTSLPIASSSAACRALGESFSCMGSCDGAAGDQSAFSKQKASKGRINQRCITPVFYFVCMTDDVQMFSSRNVVASSAIPCRFTANVCVWLRLFP